MSGKDQLMRKRLSLALALGLFGFLPLLPGSALAALFTLASAVQLEDCGVSCGNNDLGVNGFINPVTDFDLSDILLSDVGGNLIGNEGGVSLTSVDIFVVDVSLDAGSAAVDALGFSIGLPFLNVGALNLLHNPVGAGALNDAGGVAPINVVADNVSDNRGLFVFGNLVSTGLVANTTSVRLFTVYERVAGGGNIVGAGQSVAFMVSSGTNFPVQGIVAVPEAGTSLLFAAGCLGLLGAARRVGRKRTQ